MAYKSGDPVFDGNSAYAEGVGRDQNPYTGDDAKLWDKGWIQARQRITYSSPQEAGELWTGVSHDGNIPIRQRAKENDWKKNKKKRR